jgi:hypothetical protein
MSRVFTYSIDDTNLPKGSVACIEWALTQWAKSTSNRIQFYRTRLHPQILFTAGKPPDGSQAYHHDLGNGVHSIIFNPALPWATTWWHRFLGRVPDFRRLALHEIGHALGIVEHSDDPTSIMHARPTVSNIGPVVSGWGWEN